MPYKCRFCENDLGDHFLDLGHQPPSNAYLDEDKLNLSEVSYPLKVYVCKSCWLVQLPEYLPSEALFTKDYAYLSSTSTSWCKHAEVFTKRAINKLSLNQESFVIEIASNDGYLLQYFKDANINCFGIEPTSLAASEAKKKGIKTLERFFGYDLAQEIIKNYKDAYDGADLIVANNVLAHVPNINDFVAGIALLLKPNGFASIEFQHLLNILKHNQFDTIYHEHYSYLSLTFLEKLCDKHKLYICEVEELNTHGGSLRVWISRNKNSKIDNSVNRILKEERLFELEKIKTYQKFQDNALNIKFATLNFLLNCKKNKISVIGYGAAAKGNTLLNYCGIKSDLLPFIFDKARSKQGKYLPGSHIPIIDIKEIKNFKKSKMLLLPWNLLEEIKKEFSDFDIVTAIPKLKIIKSSKSKS